MKSRMKFATSWRREVT